MMELWQEYAERHLYMLDDIKSELAYIGKEMRMARTGVAEDENGKPIPERRTPWQCSQCAKFNDPEYVECWGCGRASNAG